MNDAAELLELLQLRLGRRRCRLDQHVVGVGCVGPGQCGCRRAGSGRVERDAVDGDACHASASSHCTSGVRFHSEMREGRVQALRLKVEKMIYNPRMVSEQASRSHRSPQAYEDLRVVRWYELMDGGGAKRRG